MMNTYDKVEQEKYPHQDAEASIPDESFQRSFGSSLASPLYPLSAKEAIRVAVSSRAPVLIIGERGTRKRELARAIHREGLQKETAFFAVKAERFQENMRHLLESGRELSGTLFITGVDQLSETMQGVLEDYLNSGELSLEGLSREAALRLIITSEIDPGAGATDSMLERTLLHRLSIVQLDLPPLRARKKDISLIAGYVRDRICQNYSLPRKDISADALDYLARYDWPDNLDELEGVIGRGLAACSEAAVMPWHLSLPSDLEVLQAAVPTEEEDADTPEVSSAAPMEARTDSPFSMALQLAHDIKNPLVSIKTYTNLLNDKFGDEEFRSEFYQVMRSDVEKIDRVVEEILSTARVQSDPSAENEPETEDINVNTMIDELLGDIREKLARRKIAVFKFLGDDIPEVTMQSAQSKAAVGGLLTSILDRINDTGDIYISTSRRTLQGHEGGSSPVVEIAIEGNPFEGDMRDFGEDIAWHQKILGSQGGRIELKKLSDEGGGVTIMLPLRRS